MQKSLVAFASALLIAAVLRAGEARAEARLLIDAESGKVLEGENATYPWYPASVTKLMTTYVTFKALREQRITLDTVFTYGPNAAAQQPSKMGFKVGTQVTVDNAVKMMLVHSANDMAVVLAEGVSGSIEKFSDEMNANAHRLGMTQTSYVNPNGLPADEQITSARDLAILARALIREFPEYDGYWHIGAIKFGKRIMHNTNRLLDAYPGADGMKTGFICASGYNVVASATRGDKRLIAVVLGASSSAARAGRAAQMFERGFASGPLSWLTPSYGTVDSLVPIAADPPNLREEICGKARHRPAAEDDDDTATANTGRFVPALQPAKPDAQGLRAPDLRARLRSDRRPCRSGAQARVAGRGDGGDRARQTQVRRHRGGQAGREADRPRRSSGPARNRPEYRSFAHRQTVARRGGQVCAEHRQARSDRQDRRRQAETDRNAPAQACRHGETESGGCGAQARDGGRQAEAGDNAQINA